MWRDHPASPTSYLPQVKFQPIHIHWAFGESPVRDLVSNGRIKLQPEHWPRPLLYDHFCLKKTESFTCHPPFAQHACRRIPPACFSAQLLAFIVTANSAQLSCATSESLLASSEASRLPAVGSLCSRLFEGQPHLLFMFYARWRSLVPVLRKE